MSINNRLFGAPLLPEVVKKLQDRQRVAGQAAPGESIEAVYPDADGNNQADLSSRTPFVRMWTSVKLIDPSAIEGVHEQITKEEYDASAGFNIDDKNPKLAIHKKLNRLATKYPNLGTMQTYPLGYQGNYNEKAYFIVTDSSIDIREQVEYARQTYVIGDYNYQTGYGEVSPNESNEAYVYKSPEYRNPYGYNTSADETYDENIKEAKSLVENIFKPELSTNPLLKPQSGITKVTTETEGTLGVIKKTTIDFVVNNFYDYDRIFNKFFLKPAATVFVDFGWSSVKSLYNPEELITHPTGMEDFLYAEGNVDNKEYQGVVTKNQGDLEVLQGIVTDYNSKIEKNGSVTCQLTLTSANSTLLSFKTDEKVVQNITTILERGLLFLGVQAILREQAENDTLTENITNDLQQLLNTPDSSTEATDVQNYNKNLGALAFKLLSSRNGTPSGNSIRAGVFVEHQDMDNTYISFGLFEDLIINSQFGFGKDEADINKGKNGQVRLDSSNSFTAWNNRYEKSQQVILAVSEPSPAFLYPEWWGNTDPNGKDGGGSYTFQQGKWPKQDDVYLSSNSAEEWQNFNTGKEMSGFDRFIHGRIPIRELFINTEIIINAFNQNDTVKKVLKQIIDDINQYSGNLMSLTLIKGDTESQLKIADKNYTEFDEKDKSNVTLDLDKTFTFNIMSPNSIVKDYNLEFKIPPGDIGNMYAIQGMSHGDSIFTVDESINALKNLNKLDDDSFSIIYEPDLGTYRLKQYCDTNNNSEVYNVYNQINKMFSTDTYNVNTNPPRESNIEGTGEDAMFSSEDVIENDVVKSEEPKAPDLQALVKQNDALLSAVGIKVAQTFTEYYNYQVTDEVVRKVPKLLPYTLSLTTYGIASIQPGETFKVDYLPKTYLDKTYLQIMKVRHDVGPDGWYTSFDTQFRLKEFVISNQEKETPIRLSGNALINLGFDNQLTIDDKWDFLTGDSYIGLQQFVAYMTDIQVRTPQESFDTIKGDKLDFIVDFKTTNQISEVIQENKSSIQNIVTNSFSRRMNTGTLPILPRGTDFRHVYDNRNDVNDDIKSYNLPRTDILSKKKESKNRLFERVYGGVNSQGLKQLPGERTSVDYYQLNIAPKNVVIKPNKKYQFYVSKTGIAIVDPDMFAPNSPEEQNYIEYWNTHAGMTTFRK